MWFLILQVVGEGPSYLLPVAGGSWEMKSCYSFVISMGKIFSMFICDYVFDPNLMSKPRRRVPHMIWREVQHKGHTQLN